MLKHLSSLHRITEYSELEGTRKNHQSPTLVTCCRPVLGKEQGVRLSLEILEKFNLAKLLPRSQECQAGWDLSSPPHTVSGWLLFGPVTQLHLPPTLQPLQPSLFMENVH